MKMKMTICFRFRFITTFIFFIIGSQNVNAASSNEKCEKIKIGDDYYRRYLLAAFDGHPTGLVVDPRNDNIFFVLHQRNYTRGVYVLNHGSLGIKELTIPDDFTGQCVGYDQANRIMYIGTNQGLMTYDHARIEINTERPIGDDDVRSIFFDKSDSQMYIITGPNQEVYRFINGSAAVKRFDKIPRAYSFVLDSKGNAFYEYIDGRLYFFNVDYYEPIQYKGFSKELKYILQLDNSDEAILAVKGTLFKLTANNILPNKLGNLGFKITGLAFDKRNNIVIGGKGKLYRYKLVDANESCPNMDDFITSM